MIKKFVVEQDGKRTEINYAELSMRDINSRIRGYERKYGSSFSRYLGTFSCDDARGDEMTDVMDWEYLVAEKAQRMKTPKGEKIY